MLYILCSLELIYPLPVRVLYLFLFNFILVKDPVERLTAYQFLILYNTSLKSFWEHSVNEDLQAECRMRHSESLTQKNRYNAHY